jgi:type I restriction enzyme S subunit
VTARNTVQLRRLFRVVNGGTPTSDEINWGGGIHWATPVDLGRVHGRTLDGTGRTLSEVGLRSGSAAIPARSLIISTRAPIGYVAETATPTAFNQGCRGLVPAQPLDTRFYRYVVVSMSSELQAAGQGSTFVELSGDALSQVRVPSPPVPVQRAIADFLDTQTGRIDALISKKRQMMDLLEELGTATLIHRALQGWGAERTAPLKRVARPVLVDGNAEDEIVTAYRDGRVTTRSTRRADGYTLGEEDAPLLRVRQGQLVFHGLDGFAGAVGIAEMDGKCSPAYHVCDIPSPHFAAFFAFQLRALALTGYLEVQSSTVRQRAVDLRNWDRFGSLSVVIPPSERQQDAVRAITAARDHARRLVDRLSQQLALLQEHRQALITAAVTGELDVPGVAA